MGRPPRRHRRPACPPRGAAHPVLDDHAYQSGIRPALHESVFGGAIGPVDDDTEARALRRIGQELQSRLDDLLAGDDDWTVASVALPWHRSFEIDIALAPR